jgi:prepilin peptidase CpaA
LKTLPPAIEIALAVLAIAAAGYDLKFRRIPNWLVLAGIVAGFALNIFFFGLAGLGRAAFGLAAATAVYLPLFALRAMGGGDVKLMAAIGSMAGAGNWFVLFLIASIAGGVMAVVLLLVRGGLRRTVLNVLDIFAALLRLRAPFRERPELDVAHSSAVTLPHGVSIAIGTFLFIALSHNAP